MTKALAWRQAMVVVAAGITYYFTGQVIFSFFPLSALPDTLICLALNIIAATVGRKRNMAARQAITNGQWEKVKDLTAWHIVFWATSFSAAVMMAIKTMRREEQGAWALMVAVVMTLFIAFHYKKTAEGVAYCRDRWRDRCPIEALLWTPLILQSIGLIVFFYWYTSIWHP
jgi:uncharacterized membrane protein